MLSLSSFFLIAFLIGLASLSTSATFPKLVVRIKLFNSSFFYLTGLILLFSFFGFGIPSGLQDSNFGNIREEHLIPLLLLFIWGVLWAWEMLQAKELEAGVRNIDFRLLYIGSLGTLATTNILLFLILAFDVFCWSLAPKPESDDTTGKTWRTFFSRLFASNLHSTQFFGSVFLWLGGIIFAVSFQSIWLNELSSIPVTQNPTAFIFAQIGFVLIFSGAASHLHLLPFHWSSWLYIRTSNFSGMLKIKSFLLLGGFLFFLRFFVEINHNMETLFQTMVIISAFLSILSAVVMLPGQRELKTLLFSLLNFHTALLVLLFGLAAWESQYSARSLIGNSHWPGASSTAFFLLVSTIIGTLGIVAGSCSLKIGNQQEVYPENVAGWLRNDFYGAFCWLASLATLVGLPLTIGFWSRVSLLQIALSTQTFNSITSLYRFHEGYWMLALFLVFAMSPFVMIFFRYASHILFEPSRKVLKTKKSTFSSTLLLLSAVFSIGIGIFPGPALEWLAKQNQHVKTKPLDDSKNVESTQKIHSKQNSALRKMESHQ